MTRVHLVLLLLAAIPAPVSAGWFSLARQAHALVAERADGRVLSVCGQLEGDGGFSTSSDVLEWRGQRWSPVREKSPPRLYGHAISIDPASGRALLFGGDTGVGSTNSTWLHVPQGWQRLAPDNSPTPRARHAMAYDEERKTVVLFGGGQSGDTWTWDGTDWFQQTPERSPPALKGHAMAYDASRHSVVLFGGTLGASVVNHTWEWDGETWTRIEVEQRPPARAMHSLVYDPDRKKVVMMMGTNGQGGYFDDLWEYDGQTWISRKTGTKPPGRAGHGAVRLPGDGRIVIFGGVNAQSRALSDTWGWNGSRWELLGQPAENSLGVSVGAFDPGSGKTLCYSVKTYLWDGATCEEQAVAESPPARVLTAMATDEARGRVVLFGGRGNSRDDQGDTWEWSGAQWSQVASPSPTSPAARSAHAMSRDTAGSGVFLFGGNGSGGPLDDSWSWNGLHWRRHAPQDIPPKRGHHALATDSKRARIVLFGGYAGGLLDDTWEWNGSNWKQMTVPLRPPARSRHAMAYDPVAGVVVLTGGGGDSGPLADNWGWDGARWQKLSDTPRPPARQLHALVYDAMRHCLVLLGGVPERGDIWEKW